MMMITLPMTMATMAQGLPGNWLKPMLLSPRKKEKKEKEDKEDKDEKDEKNRQQR